MRTIEAKNRYLKDLKRQAKRGYDLSKLTSIVFALRTDAPLPPSARPHKLVSQAEEIWDVHIAPDWILLYEISDEHLVLHRTGTHSDLF